MSEAAALPVLLVDDEPQILRSYENVLRNAGIAELVTSGDSRAAAGLLAERDFAVAVLDLMMPGLSGEELLAVAARRNTPVVVVSAKEEADTVVRCMQAGALDYVVKPITASRLETVVRKGMEVSALRRENARLRACFLDHAAERSEAFAPIVTRDPQMLAIFRYVTAVASSSECALILGETGTGKELMALAIHRASGRSGEFVPVNVAGLDDQLFADTLFGHVRGAYTGATGPRRGLIEKAAGGTLFLDEIGDLSPVSQMKLLRLLQEHEYFPLGSDVPCRSRAVVVAATNRDLEELVRERRFREDLYYRIATHRIRIPPLRERPDDIPLLLRHFVVESARQLGRDPVPVIGAAALVAAQAYAFPGNIREMKAIIHDAVTRSDGGSLRLEIAGATDRGPQAADYRPQGTDGSPQTAGRESKQVVFPAVLPTVQDMTDALIEEAVRRCGGNQTKAADLLGISRQTLNRRLSQLSKNATDRCRVI